MMRAIDVLAEHTKYKILVMGDMAEQGEHAVKHHTDLAAYILDKKIDLVLGVGKLTSQVIAILGSIGHWYKTNNDLIIALDKFLRKECIVLVKGSRFMKMEDIVRALEDGNA